MRYAIITQTLDSGPINPGTQFIHYGIQHVISEVDPKAVFFSVCQDGYIEEEWRCVKEQADVLIFGGGPRINSNPKATCFCDWDIWSYVSMAMDWGIPVWDIAAGATHYLPLPAAASTMALRMIGIPKVMQILTYYSGVQLITTRDPVITEIFKRSKMRAYLLPCIAYWSREYWGIEPSVEKKYNVVTIRRILGHEQYLAPKIMKAFHGLLSEKETKLIAHVEDDATWFREAAQKYTGRTPFVEVINDPKYLTGFYAAADKVISFRLHGSVMALSMGAKVLNVAIDSGSFCLDQFDVESIYFPDLRRKEIPLDRFQETDARKMNGYKQLYMGVLKEGIDAVQAKIGH